jgi:membrane-associated phospholipid phosphatase
MKYLSIRLFFLAFMLIAPGIAEAVVEDQETDLLSEPALQKKPPALSPFSNLGNNIFNSFIGPTTLLHLSAAASTVVMVHEDWDYLIYKRAQSYRKYQRYFNPTIYSGATSWFVIATPLLLYGLVEDKPEIVGAAYAVLQSTLIGITYATILKALTGRPGPDPKWYSDMRGQSRTFRFGYLRGGVFNGWPGGHVLITTATMASLMHYYPDKWWLKVAGFLLIAYTIVGMVMTQGHWMSDNVAGFLMGYAIGSTVGRSYRVLMNGRAGPSAGEVEFFPSIGPASAGLRISFRF